MIPLVDLKLQYQLHKAEIDAAMQEAAANAQYILGPNVKALEADLAAYCDCKRGVGVGNCTDGLHLALRALRIGPGDEVITSPFTFVATTEAIGIVGATPVFVDIDPATFNMDPSLIEAAITPRTRVILPVHLYGQPCDMDPIMAIARKHGLRVVEDCAQAIGATYHGRKVGSFGDIGCLSFFPSKNLGCFGDGGMVVTNDEELYGRVEMLRRHGGRVKYHHEEIGLNSRLDELQGAILRVKFRYLEEWTEARRRHAVRYNELLAGTPNLPLPSEIADVRAVYHQYTVRVKDRKAIQATLAEAGVSSFVYYPVPLHLQEVHADRGYERGAFGYAEAAADEVLSLPMFPEMTEEQQQKVARAVRAASHGQ
ncbi:MAG: DegT/DnrJ/EryC1/StrS family aminotransferase [Armatimonadetes bacterium]|nr:DegT/DnrJ/EryC1/StrS family aminotransferase [Armatimonadota bacterium]